jgi:hypothetical protein
VWDPYVLARTETSMKVLINGFYRYLKGLMSVLAITLITVLAHFEHESRRNVT